MSKTTTTKFSVGDRIEVKAGMKHDGMEDMTVGTIKEISTPALGIQFDGSDEIHRWYVDEEIEPSSEASSKGDSEKDDKKKNDKGMDMQLPSYHRWLLKDCIPTRTKE